MKEHVWYDPIDDNFLITEDANWNVARMYKGEVVLFIYLGEL